MNNVRPILTDEDIKTHIIKTSERIKAGDVYHMKTLAELIYLIGEQREKDLFVLSNIITQLSDELNPSKENNIVSCLNNEDKKKYFSDISEKVYGIHEILVTDNRERGMLFNKILEFVTIHYEIISKREQVEVKLISR